MRQRAEQTQNKQKPNKNKKNAHQARILHFTRKTHHHILRLFFSPVGKSVRANRAARREKIDKPYFTQQVLHTLLLAAPQTQQVWQQKRESTRNSHADLHPLRAVSIRVLCSLAERICDSQSQRGLLLDVSCGFVSRLHNSHDSPRQVCPILEHRGSAGAVLRVVDDRISSSSLLFLHVEPACEKADVEVFHSRHPHWRLENSPTLAHLLFSEWWNLT